MMTLCSTVLINIVKQLNILGTSVIKSTLLNRSCTLLVFITGGLHNNFNNMDCIGLKKRSSPEGRVGGNSTQHMGCSHSCTAHLH